MDKSNFISLRKKFIEDQFRNLNPMQLRAALSTEGPLLLLAGAGSGKTTVLINRIINILRFGKAYESDYVPAFITDDDEKKLEEMVRDPSAFGEDEIRRICAVDPPMPWQIAAITFTNKAARELKDRLQAACGDESKGIYAYTFHSFCSRLLRRYIDRLGYPLDFTIYDEEDKKKLLELTVKELGYDTKRFDIKGVASAISKAKDQLLTPAEYSGQWAGDYYKERVGIIYDAYQKKMKAAGALDFDDMIVKTVELFKNESDVREKYQRQFRYVLVDEYQDTDHAQYLLCSLLAGGHNNLCVVGDDDQSIYKFRGATVENIIEFEERYKDAKTIRLEQNYRSTGPILNAANSVIANNSQRKRKKLWTSREGGEKVNLFIAENQEDEAQYIASKIVGSMTSRKRLSDYAVLYRNHALSNAIEMAFKRNRIPYRIFSGLRFFDRAEVKDMLAYLWVINNPSDTIHLRRIINNPPRHIGAKTVETLEALAEEQGTYAFKIAEEAGNYPELSRSLEAIGRFTDLINGFRSKVLTESLPDVYDELLDMSGYLADLQDHPGVESEAKTENVFELKSSILEYCGRTENPTLAGFLDEIALITDIDRYDDTSDAVVMMTIHSSKGLEFDTVFMCGTEEGIFPSYRSLENDEELEEERRLCYVAMTRAKNELHITASRRRMLYGQTSFAHPSRFIDEIDRDCIENRSAVKKAPEYIDREYNRGYGGGYGTDRPGPERRDCFIAEKKTVPQNTSVVFKKNMRVVHKAFGEGTVKNVTPVGGDHLVEIEFLGVGNKLMMAKTAAQFIKIL